MIAVFILFMVLPIELNKSLSTKKTSRHYTESTQRSEKSYPRNK